MAGIQQKNATDPRVGKSCCVLHNHPRGNENLVNMQERLNPENQPYLNDDETIIDINNTHEYRSANAACQIQNPFKEYTRSRIT